MANADALQMISAECVESWQLGRRRISRSVSDKGNHREKGQ
jgi:hypothetical protein